MFNMGQFNFENHWHEEDIQLTRVCNMSLIYINSDLVFFVRLKPVNGNQSLGITIDGGSDKPFVYRRFTSIIITGNF